MLQSSCKEDLKSQVTKEKMTWSLKEIMNLFQTLMKSMKSILVTTADLESVPNVIVKYYLESIRF